jgi:hypothetical protein
MTFHGPSHSVIPTEAEWRDLLCIIPLPAESRSLDSAVAATFSLGMTNKKESTQA